MPEEFFEDLRNSTLQFNRRYLDARNTQFSDSELDMRIRITLENADLYEGLPHHGYWLAAHILAVRERERRQNEHLR